MAPPGKGSKDLAVSAAQIWPHTSTVLKSFNSNGSVHAALLDCQAKAVFLFSSYEAKIPAPRPGLYG